MSNKTESISKTIQLVSVVIGVVISVLSFNAARKQEALSNKAVEEARIFEIKKYYDQRTEEDRKRKIEAAKPFLELRQKRYAEVIQLAGILSNPEGHTSTELDNARKRFRQLYVAELSMVEDQSVESAMIELAKHIDPDLGDFNPKQKAAYNLSHALRNSLVNSWSVDEKIVNNPNQ